MKIYHKKNFIFGLLLTLYAVVMFIYGIRRGFGPFLLGLPVMSLISAGIWILRGLSKERAKRDLLEEQDERNRYIRLKSSRRTLQITRAACFILMVVLLLRSGENDGLFTAGLCFFAVFTFSYLAELGAALWYEHRS